MIQYISIILYQVKLQFLSFLYIPIYSIYIQLQKSLSLFSYFLFIFFYVYIK